MSVLLPFLLIGVFILVRTINNSPLLWAMLLQFFGSVHSFMLPFTFRYVCFVRPFQESSVADHRDEPRKDLALVMHRLLANRDLSSPAPA
jgi:hypothetical protein